MCRWLILSYIPIYAAIVFLIPPIRAGEVCKEGWQYFKGSCYQFTNISADYTTAKKICHESNSHIIITDTVAEAQYVKDKLNTRIWLGFEYEEGKFNWKWDDGTSFIATQPDFYPKKVQKPSCVVYNTRLRLADCTVQHPFVCKYPKLLDQKCKYGWVDFEGNCYYFNNTQITRDNAYEICESHQSFLTTVNTLEEMNFLNTIKVGATIHTGLRIEKKNEPVFAASNRNQFGYIKWSGIEPTVEKYEPTYSREKCVELVLYVESLSFNDAECNLNRHFICEAEVKACKPGWSQVGTFCFKAVNQVLTNKEAKHICNEYNAQLASIESEEEKLHVARMLPNRYYQVGAEKIDGTWTWIDGTGRVNNSEIGNTSKGIAQYLILDRNSRKYHEIDEYTGKDLKEQRLFSAICKYNVMLEGSRPCKDSLSDIKGSCHKPKINQQKRKYKVQEGKCEKYYKFEKDYLQAPKYVEVDNGKWGYCIYYFKASPAILKKSEIENGKTSFDVGEKFCARQMYGHLIYPEDEEEFSFMHGFFNEEHNSIEGEIGLSPITEHIHLYSGEDNLRKSIWRKIGNSEYVIQAGFTDRTCYPNWKHINGSCYRLYVEPLNYDSATSFCNAMTGTRLAVFTNLKQLKEVWTQLPDKIDTFWIGLKKVQETWQWSDGSSVKPDAWEMDDNNKSSGCGASHSGEKIMSLECSESHSFVCEYKNHAILSKNDGIDKIVCKTYQNSTEFEMEARKFNVSEMEAYEDDKEFYCPRKWIKEGDMCFKLYSESLSWDEAERRCEARHSMLAVFEDRTQHKKVSARFGKNEFWIGLRERNKVWQWSNGKIAEDFDRVGDETKKCASGGSETSSVVTKQFWNSNRCIEKKPYMCSFKLTTSCEFGFIEFKGYCYALIELKKSFGDATRVCSSKLSTVVQVLSAEEEEFLRQYAKFDFWIDIKCNESIPSRLSYSNWKKGELEKCQKGGSDLYATSRNSKWVVTSERAITNVICKYRKGFVRMIENFENFKFNRKRHSVQKMVRKDFHFRYTSLLTVGFLCLLIIIVSCLSIIVVCTTKARVDIEKYIQLQNKVYDYVHSPLHSNVFKEGIYEKPRGVNYGMVRPSS